MIDLEEFPVTDRIEFLREHMLAAPVPLMLDPHPGAELVVHSRVSDLGHLHLLSTKARGGDVVRTPRLARDTTLPSLMITVIDHGTTAVVRADQAMTLKPGDLGLYLTSEPYRLRFSDGARRHTFQFPLDQLDLPEALIRGQVEQPIHPDDATTAAISAFLLSAGRTAPSTPSTTLSELERPALDLSRLLLTRAAPDTPIGREAAARSLATRIEEFIRSHLDDPDLCATSIARAFSISERYLYTILSRRGIDLGEMIRQRRLEHAAALLEDPRHAKSTISAIAYQTGFSDHAHFSRAFRAHFGTTPTEWRHLARNGGTGS